VPLVPAVVRVVVIVLVLAVTLVSASAAEGRGWQPLGRAWGPAQTDGRYLVVYRTTGVVELSDPRSGATTSLAASPGCHPAGLGGGEVLWDCSTWRHVTTVRGTSAVARVDAELLDIRTGRRWQPLGMPAMIDGEAISLGGIGKWWITGRQLPPPSRYHDLPEPLWFNRRTGAWSPLRTKRRYVPNTRTVVTREVLDPDTPVAIHRLCPPLELRGVQQPFVDDFGPATYADGHLLTQGIHLRRRSPSLTGAVTLQRCGHRVRHVLDPCPGGCRGAKLARGLVSWADGRAIAAYDLRTRRHHVWPHALPDAERRVYLTATDTALVRSVSSAGEWQIATIGR
jgi:hypothetical protein